MVFENETPGCIHNSMVECPLYLRDCTKCGWDPEVSRKRLQSFAQTHPELSEELVRMGKLTVPITSC